jgi:hypothetical protein
LRGRGRFELGECFVVGAADGVLIAGERGEGPAAVERADKIVVYELPPSSSEILYSATGRRDIEEFKAAITIEPGAVCACPPRWKIGLFRKGEKIGSILLLPSLWIHCCRWASDALIAHRERWLKWFDARKIHGPRR